MDHEKMEWFHNARYGMFIHWGLYAIPGGEWKGVHQDGATEWLLKEQEIPFAEYRTLMDQFNPVDFDADEWVRMAAEEFGVKYIVFTAKHCEGFAMYDSKASDFNVMNSPYGKDIVRALAQACEKHRLTFCVYYSQYQDWGEPHGYGNDWDYGPESEKDFRRYFEEKVKPQVQELLTSYGRIGLIWFDTPYEMDKAQCRELADLVHELQPDCLINSRVGNGFGDYREMSDNSIPAASCGFDWETPMTLNGTWGYSQTDENWKTPETVIRMLINVTGKGGNLLLNVGPDARGVIPGGSVEVMRSVGTWLKANGESIYNTRAVPNFPYQLNFGGVTYHPDKNRLYLHAINYPVAPYTLFIYGLKTKVTSAGLLSTGESIPFNQTYETGRDEYVLRIYLPEKNPDPLDCVVYLEMEGEVEVQPLRP